MPKRGPTAFQHFLNSLRETDQSHLAERLLSNVPTNNGIDSTDDHDNYATIRPVNNVSESSFEFSSLTSTKKQLSSDKKLFPVESFDPSVTAVFSNNTQNFSSKKQRVAPENRCQNGTNAMNFSVNELDDLSSNESFDSLATASCLKMPKSSKINTSSKLSGATTHHCNILNNCDSKFISHCDLSDGPTYNDLIVRRSPAMIPVTCVLYFLIWLTS